MKYKSFNYLISWTWFVIFPTITILKDEPQYLDKNFSIQFHWLGFHLRWFWMKESEDKNFVGMASYSDFQLKIHKEKGK